MSNMFSMPYTGAKKSMDEGLRKYMLSIYNLMTIALVISGVTAYAFMSVPALTSLIYNVSPSGMISGHTGLGTVLMFAPIGIAMYFFWGSGRIDVRNAQMLFWVYAALTGASLSILGFIYTGASIAKTLFITASSFGAMSIYGYTTKKDLTSMGSFLFMGVIGLLISSLVNMFLQSPALDFALSFIGVLVFMGLTAYDTQRLKEIYYSAGGGEYAQRLAIVGAFTLYLDFINLFLYLIRFLGVKKGE